eukprot:gene2156-12650_t
MSKQSRLLVTALDGSAAPPCVDVQLSYTCDRAGAPLTLAAKFTVLSGTQVWNGVRTENEFQTDVKELLAFDLPLPRADIFNALSSSLDRDQYQFQVLAHASDPDSRTLKWQIKDGDGQMVELGKCKLLPKATGDDGGGSSAPGSGQEQNAILAETMAYFLAEAEQCRVEESRLQLECALLVEQTRAINEVKKKRDKRKQSDQTALLDAMCKALNAKKRRGTVVGRGGGRTPDPERTALKLANSKRNGKEPAAAATAADGDDSESFGGEAYTEDYLEEASDSDDALSDDYNTDEEKSLIRQESEERHERSDSRRNSFSSVGAANGDGVGGATLEGGVDVYNAETQDAEADSDAQVSASIDRASAQSTPELSEADSDSSLEALL